MRHAIPYRPADPPYGDVEIDAACDAVAGPHIAFSTASLLAGPATAVPIRSVTVVEPGLQPAPGGWQWLLKRLIDVVTASVLLLVGAPLVLASCLAIKLTDGGPVLFRQERIGRGGRPFTMLKLRTFPVGHEDVARHLPTSACPTRLGRFLRRTNLDELPQLINVVRGDMSLVGPRPERTRFAIELAGSVPGFAARHRVSGGITGLAQVDPSWYGGNLEDRVRLDNDYIDRWSLRRDLSILARTLPALLRKLANPD